MIMDYIMNFISKIEPNGLPYLWVNGIDFVWEENHWAVLSEGVSKQAHPLFLCLVWSVVSHRKVPATFLHL